MNTFIVALGTESISGLGDIWFKWWGGEEGVRGTILPVLLSVMIYMSVWLCVHMHVCYAVWIPKLVARAWILQVFQSFLVKHCYQCNNFQYPHLVYCLQNIRKGQIVWARPKWRIPTKKEKASINITRAIYLLSLSLSHNSLSWIIYSDNFFCASSWLQGFLFCICSAYIYIYIIYVYNLCIVYTNFYGYMSL